jgi:transposase
MDTHDFAGIEVSAEELIVAVEREGRTVRLECFANDAPGHQAVLRFLCRTGHTVRACMESTGVYGLDLALVLARAGIDVMVANPRAARHFATAMMQRSKNDRLDARVLLEFVKRMPFQAWTPPRPAMLQLHALSRRLEALKDTQAAEQNRLHAARATDTTPAAVRRDLERSLRSLRRAVARLTVEAVKIIRQDSGLQLRFDLLLSAKGIGETSAIALLAELALAPEDLDVRQLVAYAGLDPREHSSGSSVHKKPRISKHGNVHLRRALYMPALVALRHQPNLRAFYEHLRARGKAKMVALVAVMRKLLHAIYGMFKHRTAFDGHKVFVLPASEISTTEAAA